MLRLRNHPRLPDSRIPTPEELEKDLNEWKYGHLKECSWLEGPAINGNQEMVNRLVEIATVRRTVDELLASLRDLGYTFYPLEPRSEILKLVPHIKSEICYLLWPHVRLRPEEGNKIREELSSNEVDWVVKNIDKYHEIAVETYKRSGVLRYERIPLLPTKENLITSALRRLSSEQVDFMMQMKMNPFRFQIALNGEPELNEKLLLGIGQCALDPNSEWSVPVPALHHDMLFPEDFAVQGNLTAHIFQRHRGELRWDWEFFQGGWGQSEPWDDARMPVGLRFIQHMNKLPQGMKMTDFPTWATRTTQRFVPKRDEWIDYYHGFNKSKTVLSEGYSENGPALLSAQYLNRPSGGLPLIMKLDPTCDDDEMHIRASVSGSVDR